MVMKIWELYWESKSIYSSIQYSSAVRILYILLYIYCLLVLSPIVYYCLLVLSKQYRTAKKTVPYYGLYIFLGSFGTVYWYIPSIGNDFLRIFDSTLDMYILRKSKNELKGSIRTKKKFGMKFVKKIK